MMYLGQNHVHRSMYLYSLGKLLGRLPIFGRTNKYTGRNVLRPRMPRTAAHEVVHPLESPRGEETPPVHHAGLSSTTFSMVHVTVVPLTVADAPVTLYAVAEL